MADTIDDRKAPVHLPARTSTVLFDFDRPVCRLSPKSTAGIARSIKRTAQEIWGPLDPDVRAGDDSHHVLRRRGWRLPL